jgi:hypothetical protein
MELRVELDSGAPTEVTVCSSDNVRVVCVEETERPEPLPLVPTANAAGAAVVDTTPRTPAPPNSTRGAATYPGPPQMAPRGQMITFANRMWHRKTLTVRAGLAGSRARSRSRERRPACNARRPGSRRVSSSTTSRGDPPGLDDPDGSSWPLPCGVAV